MREIHKGNPLMKRIHSPAMEKRDGYFFFAELAGAGLTYPPRRDPPPPRLLSQSGSFTSDVWAREFDLKFSSGARMEFWEAEVLGKSNSFLCALGDILSGISEIAAYPDNNVNVFP